MISRPLRQLAGLAWTIVRTDFKVRYHGTAGGFLWAPDHTDPVWAGQTALSWIPGTVPYVAETESPGTYRCRETVSSD